MPVAGDGNWDGDKKDAESLTSVAVELQCERGNHEMALSDSLRFALSPLAPVGKGQAGTGSKKSILSSTTSSSKGACSTHFKASSLTTSEKYSPSGSGRMTRIPIRADGQRRKGSGGAGSPSLAISPSGLPLKMGKRKLEMLGPKDLHSKTSVLNTAARTRGSGGSGSPSGNVPNSTAPFSLAFFHPPDPTSDYRALNPGFTLYEKSVSAQLEEMKQEYNVLEVTTQNSTILNFSTSMHYKHLNRYFNVTANEDTLFPPLKVEVEDKGTDPLYEKKEKEEEEEEGKGSGGRGGGKGSCSGFSKEKEDSFISESDMDEQMMNEFLDNGERIEQARRKFRRSLPPFYINANYMDVGLPKEQVLLASQAPIPEGFPHFYGTLLKYQISLIIMLSKEMEGNFCKADPYWPPKTASFRHPTVVGPYRLWYGLEGEGNKPYETNESLKIIYRHFFIQEEKDYEFNKELLKKKGPEQAHYDNVGEKNKGEKKIAPPVEYRAPHKVELIQYVGWPDHGVPSSSTSFTSLLSRIDRYFYGKHLPTNMNKNSSQCLPEASCCSLKGKVGDTFPTPTCAATATSSSSSPSSFPPILIHCSAGLGRTATLIGCYAAIYRVREGTFSDQTMKEIVTQMRRCRFGSIQRVEQYMFMYQVIMSYMGMDVGDLSGRIAKRSQAVLRRGPRFF